MLSWKASLKNTEHVTLLWNLFNKVLAKVSKDQTTRFNPVGWCTDIAGANLAGIAKVFGEEGKVALSRASSTSRNIETKWLKN